MTDEEYNKLVEAVDAFDDIEPFKYYRDVDYMELAKVYVPLREALGAITKRHIRDNDEKAVFLLIKAAYDILGAKAGLNEWEE